jgi:hypothetical protein
MIDFLSFKQYILKIENCHTILNNNYIDLMLELLSINIDGFFVLEKLKLYVYECSFGKKPKEYFIKNGKQKIIVNSIKKLWEFIKE